MTERARASAPLVVAELALLLLTVVAALGLGRLVTGGDWFGKVLVCAVAAHGLGALGRRQAWPGWVVGVVSAIGLVVLLGILHVPSTTTWGVPTTHTFEELGNQLDAAAQAFAEVDAPAPFLPGYVIAWSIAIWIIALTADAAAFRARATFESIVPATSLFVFASALGTERNRLIASVTFLAAALLAWLAQRALGRTGASSWMGGQPARGVQALLVPGALLVAVASVLALVVGPRVPGAAAEAIIPWEGGGDGDGETSRTAISPLVDIRTRLVQQSDVEVFTVRSERPSYWRLTSLDQFDGRIWSSDRTYAEAEGTLDGPDVLSRADTVQVSQRFTITNLTSVWLPAVYRPVFVSGTDARYNADSGTLLTNEETVKGETYRVESLLPVLTATELSTGRAVAPRSLIATYTALPSDFSDDVADEAFRVVGNTTTPYQRALALQNYFRGGNRFTYDLQVQSGHDGDALEAFLFETRRGYCEQFAGAFAAMARAVGLPARVAVGFTPGEEVSPGNFLVKGLNAHAWPEVYIDGYGWVAFEPTPGRGMPGAQSYTGVTPAQANERETPDTPTGPDATTPTQPGEETEETIPDEVVTGGGLLEQDDDSWTSQVWPVLITLVALVAGWLALLAVARWLRTSGRRRAARAPAERVGVAWAEATEALDRGGVPPRPSETPYEFARRAGTTGLAGADDLDELARAATAATYGGRPLADGAADGAVEAAARIRRSVSDAIGRRRRLASLFDPRPLLADRAAGRVDIHEERHERRDVQEERLQELTQVGGRDAG